MFTLFSKIWNILSNFQKFSFVHFPTFFEKFGSPPKKDFPRGGGRRGTRLFLGGHGQQEGGSSIPRPFRKNDVSICWLMVINGSIEDKQKFGLDVGDIFALILGSHISSGNLLA